MKVVWDGEHPDEGSIHAWIDGEIDADDAARLEEHLRSCQRCTAAAAEARGLAAGASRVVGLLDDAPAPLVRDADLPIAPMPTAWRFLRVTPARAAIAAMLLVAVGITLTRKQGAFDSVAPSDTVKPSVAAVPAPTPRPDDHLLDSAISRRIAQEQPPRTVEAAPGAAIPPAAPPRVLAAGQLDSAAVAEQRVAAGRASFKASADSMGAPADRARADAPTRGIAGGMARGVVSPSESRDVVAAMSAEGAAARSAANLSAPVSMANRCLRIESSASGAHWGAEALPVVIVFDASGKAARVFSSTGTITDSYSTLVRAGEDSVVIRLRRIGYSGQLAVAGAGDTRPGIMRSGQQTMALSEVVVTAVPERATPDQRREAAKAVSAPAAAPPPAPGPAVPITARFVSCPTG